MSEWQAIDTAPKDGTALLLFIPNDDLWLRLDGAPPIIVGKWQELGYTLVNSGGTPVTAVWKTDYTETNHEFGESSMDRLTVSPTHWMPLPAPPIPETDQNG